MNFYFESPEFSLERTLFCGQYFRAVPCGSGYNIVLCGHSALVSQEGDRLCVSSDCLQSAEAVARALGAFDDYSDIRRLFSCDDTMNAAMQAGCGLRIMHQPLFETLISFIISQNNNIPRITGIISRLCEHFGDNSGGFYSFPSAKRLASLCESDLAPLRCGFRARYIIDASRKFASGMIDEGFVRTAPLADAAASLMQIVGVGPKVAACTLLFGADRLDSFPEDVWIKRAMAHFYKNGLPPQFAPYAGIAQQYIFVYARSFDFGSEG